MIQTQQLAKTYGKKPAVWDLNLDIKPGEVFGLLGPNGAGKTTTVRILTGLIAPTHGQAIVNGFVLGKDNDKIRQSVGLLTETPGFYDRLSAERNLFFYARLYGVETPEKSVSRYLELMELTEHRKKMVGEFSKGMKQRLAIARALLHEPQIIFLDEPTAGLDPKASKMMRFFIDKLREVGRTILLTTHNLIEAERLCDRVALLKGHILAMDTPQNLQANLFGRRIKVQGLNLQTSIMDGVRQLPFIKQAELSEDQDLLVHIQDPEQNNSQLIQWLFTQGIKVQYVTPADASLEDVYLDLISDNE